MKTSKNVSQIEENPKDKRLTTKNQDQFQEDSVYWHEQNHKQNNEQQKEKIIVQAIETYLCRGLDKRGNKNNEQNKQYEAYQLIKKHRKNSDYLLIKQMLQSLRRQSLSNEAEEHNIKFRYINESSILSMLHEIKTNKPIQYLSLIQKLQNINQQIQGKVESLLDNISYKQKQIQQILQNKKHLLEDIQILEHRNNKLIKQVGLNINQNIKKSNNKYFQKQSYSQEDDSQEQYQQQQTQLQQLNQQQQQDGRQQNSVQDQQMIQSQYRELLQYYQCYNTQNKQLTTFPKNKTQAMQLLNKIEGKIQKLQMQLLSKQINL